MFPEDSQCTLSSDLHGRMITNLNPQYERLNFFAINGNNWIPSTLSGWKERKIKCGETERMKEMWKDAHEDRKNNRRKSPYMCYNSV
jgi:hypothetical protein